MSFVNLGAVNTVSRRAMYPTRKTRLSYPPASHFALGADDDEEESSWTSDLIANAGDILTGGANLVAAFNKQPIPAAKTVAPVRNPPASTGMSGTTIALIVAGVALAGAGGLYLARN